MEKCRNRVLLLMKDETWIINKLKTKKLQVKKTQR